MHASQLKQLDADQRSVCQIAGVAAGSEYVSIKLNCIKGNSICFVFCSFLRANCCRFDLLQQSCILLSKTSAWQPPCIYSLNLPFGHV